jgi:uncharacterized protein (DUF433 family)
MNDSSKITKIGKESLVSGYHWIVIHPDYLGGRPSILGKRISVAMILEDLSAGWNIDLMEKEFGLTKDAISEALRYGSEVLKEKHEENVAS